jgi:mRNA interferase MazF
VVPFPYSEKLAEKRRPALVISSAALHADGFVWLVMITGAGKTGRHADVGVNDLAAAGLPGPSVIRASKIATIEPARILKTVGSLAPKERDAVVRAFHTLVATA